MFLTTFEMALAALETQYNKAPAVNPVIINCTFNIIHLLITHNYNKNTKISFPKDILYNFKLKSLFLIKKYLDA